MLHGLVVPVSINSNIVCDAEAIVKDVFHHTMIIRKTGDTMDDIVWLGGIYPRTIINLSVGYVRPGNESKGGDSLVSIHQQIAMTILNVLLQLSSSFPIGLGCRSRA